MVNKKEFKGYICEITGKQIKDMKLCPDKGCVWCEKLKKVKERGKC